MVIGEKQDRAARGEGASPECFNAGGYTIELRGTKGKDKESARPFGWICTSLLHRLTSRLTSTLFRPFVLAE